MTKKILTFLTFVVLSCATIKTARAECDGFYLAGRVGFAEFKLEDDRPNGLSNISDYIIDKKRFLASGALGYRYKHVRAELEYIWRDSNTGNVAGITDATFKSYSYMFALYYDFFPYSC